MITTKQTGHWTRFCLRLLLPCLLAGGGLAGCTEEVPVANQEQGQPVMMSIGSRAINADKPGEKITTLRILLVNPNNIDHTVVCNRFVSEPTDNPLKIQVVSGTYDVYVVANESNNSSTENSDLKNVRNLADLKKIKIPYDTGGINMFDNNHIQMFGIVEHVNIIAPEGEPSESNLAKITVNGSDKGTTLPVSLTRLVCKINVTLKYSSGTPQKVIIKNVPLNLTLFEETENQLGSEVEESHLPSASSTSDPLYPYMIEIKNILVPCWAFADKENTEKAPILSVDMQEGSETRTYKSVIGHAVNSNPKDYTLWRNYDYTLTAIITNNTVSVGTSVTKWKDESLTLQGGDPVIPAP